MMALTARSAPQPVQICSTWGQTRQTMTQKLRSRTRTAATHTFIRQPGSSRIRLCLVFLAVPRHLPLHTVPTCNSNSSSVLCPAPRCPPRHIRRRRQRLSSLAFLNQSITMAPPFLVLPRLPRTFRSSQLPRVVSYVNNVHKRLPAPTISGGTTSQSTPR